MENEEKLMIFITYYEKDRPWAKQVADQLGIYCVGPQEIFQERSAHMQEQN